MILQLAVLEPFEELMIPQRHAFGWQQELVPLPRSRHVEARMSDFETHPHNEGGSNEILFIKPER